jgi:hypothetical protein
VRFGEAKGASRYKAEGENRGRRTDQTELHQHTVPVVRQRRPYAYFARRSQRRRNVPGHRGVRDVRPRVRSAFAQLVHVRAAVCAVLASVALLGATPSPAPAPQRIDLSKLQSKTLLPKVPLHSEYIVAVNKLGQVTHVISGKVSKDKTYNLQTYGNAMQAFIRTPDGKAISGRYKLTYDYSPKTTRIHREVALVERGTVDANAPGAVIEMYADVRKHQSQKSKASAAPAPAPTAAQTPGPQPSGTFRLPDLKSPGQ